MKFLRFLSLALLLFLGSCKKDEVDASSMKSFQESINEMATSLNTLQQTKFNEALYILKTFAVEGETDIQRLEALAKLINAKKVPDIFALADEVAKKNNVDWSSTAPPSLGEMNIFQNLEAEEIDANDILAESLEIIVNPIEMDSIMGAKALRVIPSLIDRSGKKVEFANAGLETIMEIYSGGERLLTSKNVMTDHHFKGFYLKLNTLPAEKIVDEIIDIKVSVKTTSKTHQFLKTGVLVNAKALKPTAIIDEEIPSDKLQVEKPENVVNKFLSNLNHQNLRGAYELSENPQWGGFEQFSNPNSGFGGVKNIKIKKVHSQSHSDKNAVVNALYEVVDLEGNTTELNVSYSLKQTEDSWKIIGYKINSSEKQ
ncbi:MAG: hypothetical protein Q4A00_01335 [Flavobacteriaceae bacterium]|nr:hypothetical protein [Flavobacteriaceae bacterium]